MSYPKKITRRAALRNLAFGSLSLAAVAKTGGNLSAAIGIENTPLPPFDRLFPRKLELPPLPYAPSALEPHIDARTMEIHHGKHHRAYIDAVNKLIGEQPGIFSKTTPERLIAGLGKIAEPARTILRNNLGGHLNHTLFWGSISPDFGQKPGGGLSRAIDKAFGGFGEFQKQFTSAALGVFGSGWVWLVQNTDGNLSVLATPNQDSPLMQNLRPILGLDVWEHAYYLKNQNRRADYIASFWQVADWKSAGLRYGG